jgi:thiamine biosynthesis lipoprotein
MAESAPPLVRVPPFPSLGSTATLVVAGTAGVAEALAMLEGELDRIDAACSRFREDSELTALNRAPAGAAVRVSALLLEAVQIAVEAARKTNGLVDPTVGSALEWIGYDRDFAAIPPDGPPVAFVARPVPGWRTIDIDAHRSTIRRGSGAGLDLGATAKALCADRAADAIAGRIGTGVLVSLGGDIAVAGPPPPGGWPIRISANHCDPLDGPGPVVSIRGGGLATSSTAVRRWRRGGEDLHHLVDPATSRPATGRWRTVSVAAGNCVYANTASCAAIVLGDDSPAWLAARRLPSRLEGSDGAVTVVGGWPAEGAGDRGREPLRVVDFRPA